MQTLQRATVIQDLSASMLEKWLDLPGHHPIVYANVAQELARWIKSDQHESVSELAEKLWAGCDMPFTYNDSFGNRLQPDLVS
jgi:hypothetical protein